MADHEDICAICLIPVVYRTTSTSGLWYHRGADTTFPAHEPRPIKHESYAVAKAALARWEALKARRREEGTL